MRRLDNSLDAIEADLGKQADRVEEMLDVAYRGLCELCPGTAEKVLAMENVINQSEVVIEEKCVNLLALQQPMATDLRRVAGALKINADLERIADLSLNLAKRTESLTQHPEVKVPDELGKMVACALDMLRDAKTALAKSDVELAEKVIQRDIDLDKMNHHLITALVDVMAGHPDQVSGYLHVFSASRIVERMGDHATNIAEDVKYIVEGEISRHRTD